MNTPFVIVRSVTKTYRRGQSRVTALRDVSIALSQGELALLVGPSGSGKTTLLNLIAALDRPDCGEIIVGGCHVTGLSQSAAALYRNECVGLSSSNPTTCSRSLQPSRTSLCRCFRNADRIPGAPRSSSRQSVLAIASGIGLRN